MIDVLKNIVKKSPWIVSHYRRSKRAIRVSIENFKYRSYKKTIMTESEGNYYIAELIKSGKPAAVGKIGDVELTGIYYFHCHKRDKIEWANVPRHDALYYNAGVFPAEDKIFIEFSKKFLESLKQIDILAAWFNKGEANIVKNYADKAKLVQLKSLEPYYFQKPWGRVLHGKKVLVVHPFVETIKKQYLNNRKKIWQDINVLPEFELDVIKIPLSDGIKKSGFTDWFATLGYLKDQMAKKDFDIALIGAGAWGIPLAVYAKQLGKIGYHLGGATQVLFGIKGHRWDNYGFYNDAWVSPSKAETPETCKLVENGCYW